VIGPLVPLCIDLQPPVPFALDFIIKVSYLILIRIREGLLVSLHLVIAVFVSLILLRILSLIFEGLQEFGLEWVVGVGLRLVEGEGGDERVIRVVDVGPPGKLGLLHGVIGSRLATSFLGEMLRLERSL